MTLEGAGMILGPKELGYSPFLPPAERHSCELIFRQSRQVLVPSMMEVELRWINRPAPQLKWNT